MIAAIAGKTFSNRCDHMGTTLQRHFTLHTSHHFTTIVKSGFYMIATIAITEIVATYGNQPLFTILFGCFPVRLSSIPLFICFNATYQ